LNGQRAITPDTALRLARLFGTSAGMRLTLQLKYDLQTAEDELAERIEREVETLAGEAACTRFVRVWFHPVCGGTIFRRAANGRYSSGRGPFAA
jgi:hypothetical protein